MASGGTGKDRINNGRRTKCRYKREYTPVAKAHVTQLLLGRPRQLVQRRKCVHL